MLTGKKSIVSSGTDRSIKAEKLKKACIEFESFFISYLFQTMRKTVPKAGVFSGGFGKEIYTSLMDQELSRVLSQRQDIGIAKLLYKQMEKNISADNADTLHNIQTIQ